MGGDTMDALMENPVAKSKGRPKRSERDDTTIKISRALAGKLKAIAIDRGIPVAELLDELVTDPIDRAYAQMLRRLEGGKK